MIILYVYVLNKCVYVHSFVFISVFIFVLYYLVNVIIIIKFSLRTFLYMNKTKATAKDSITYILDDCITTYQLFIDVSFCYVACKRQVILLLQIIRYPDLCNRNILMARILEDVENHLINIIDGNSLSFCQSAESKS